MRGRGGGAGGGGGAVYRKSFSFGEPAFRTNNLDSVNIL